MRLTLGELRNGTGDPTTWFGGNTLVRATWGPQGPAAHQIECLPDGSVRVLDHVAGTESRVVSHPLLGDDDDGGSVVPVHAAVERAMHRFHGYRIPRSDNAYHELLPAVLGQRVTAAEAVMQWRALCERWGHPVVVDGREFRTPPDPDVLRRLPYTTLHTLGIDRRRADAVRQVARHADRLSGGWLQGRAPHERTAALRLLPGIGQWTAAIAGYVAFGDSDALEVGDFHAKNTVTYALTGRHRGSDDDMVRLLEPYAGDRERVVRWLSFDGWHAPAHGPRRPNLSIARL